MKHQFKGLGKRMGLHIVIPVVYALGLLALFLIQNAR
jgi:hypothetical protein